MRQEDVEEVKAAILQGLDGLDAKDALGVFDRLLADVQHLEAGSKQWAKRLGVEKLCGMQHTDEINAWLEAEKKRESRT
jgi:hypothetical protein